METSSYKAQVTIYVVENGMIIKDGNPRSLISKVWVASNKQELVKVVEEIYKTITPKDQE